MEKKGEGLNVTAKGTKELAVGRRLHLMVAVAYGKQGFETSGSQLATD